MREIVKEIMERAYRHFEDDGGHAALLQAIRPHVRKKTYQQNTSSAWIKGRSIPPADVLLAAALVANVRIDELLFGESIVGTVGELQTRQAGFESTLEAILKRLDELAGQ